MLSLWKFRNSICRQKRILLLLCTFGSSFIAFNYTLLSSSTSVIHAQNLISSNNEDVANGQQRYSLREHEHSTFPLKTTHSVQKHAPQRHENTFLKSNKDSFLPSTISITLRAKASLDLHTSRGAGSPKAYTANSTLKHKRFLLRQTNNRNVTANANENYNNNFYTGGRRIGSGRITFYATTKTDVDQAVVASSTPIASIISNNNPRSNSNFDYAIVSNNISTPSSPRVRGLLPNLSSTPTLPEKGSNSRTSINRSNLRFPVHPHTSAMYPFRIPACHTPTQLRRVQKRKKNLTVIENFILGRNRVRCNESITYTTHGDYRYLDNLEPLAERWNGPVSLAIYAPGTDLEESLKIISYLKLCTSSKIDEWVTFHLIYDVKYTKRPDTKMGYTNGDISWLDVLYKNSKWTDCSKKPNFTKGDDTFRMQKGLLYPINIARNIARSAAILTHFVLASDIELYPSINLIPSFIGMLHQFKKEEEEKNNYRGNKFTAAAAAIAKMLFPASQNDEFLEETQAIHQRKGGLSQDQNRRYVFVLPVFEVKQEISPGEVETKQQLATLLRNKNAVIFHHLICPQCHSFPKFDKWKLLAAHETRNTSVNDNDPSMPTMRLFNKAKRKFPFHLWEPIFIGTKDEPIYDERLSWEGLRDKMVSGYIMCVLDYDFYVLDNAFLVHKPGIRRGSHLVTKTVMSQDRLINFRIRAELSKKFGKRNDCAL